MTLLGKGGSSKVYEAFDDERKCVVAIKKVDLSDADEAQARGYINEIDMLNRLQGEDRIVKLYDHEQVCTFCAFSFMKLDPEAGSRLLGQLVLYLMNELGVTYKTS